MIKLCLTVLLAAITVTLRAEAAIQFGVLAFRPKPQTLQQWQPLAAYLETALGEPVELHAYGYPEIETAMGRHAVDVVLTNPGDYILFKHRYGLSAPLVTLVNGEAGHALKAFGGVIFARADDTGIRGLSDLAGKRIAITHTHSLGGYQMQAYELLVADLPPPANLLVIGMPHDSVVEAVLDGRADVGFARTGVLEGMSREGRLDLARLKIINRRNPPGFPWMSSTQLYPEWPVVVMPQVSERLADRLAIALLSLPPDSRAARAAGIHGFAIPADYSGVETIMRRLRVPPFDGTPEFNLADFWRKYLDMIVALGVLLTLLLVSLLALFRFFRRSQASEARFRRFFESNNAAMLLIEPVRGTIVDANAAASGFYGWPLGSLRRMSIQEINQFPPEEIAAERRLAQQEHRNYFVFPHRLADGHIRTVEVHSTPVEVDGQALLFSIVHDISQRIEVEQRLEASLAEQKAILENDLISIVRVKNRTILWANPAFEKMLGYERGELDGTATVRNYVSREDYEALGLAAYPVLSKHGVYRTQMEHVRKDGSHIWVDVSGTQLNQDESLWGFIDISDRIDAETRMRLAASVFAHAGEGIMITDPEGALLEVNEAFTRITGYTRAEVLGHNPRFLASGRHDRVFFSELWRALNEDGHWKGEVWNRRKDGAAFASLQVINAVRDGKGRTLHYLSLFSDVTEQKEHQQHIEHIAHYDALTGLPNRVLLADRLERSMARSVLHQRRLALAYLDLDGFKAVNDTYGHDTGDRLLVAVARRMRRAVRDGDTVARLGGDEFVAVLQDLADTEASLPLLQRLLDASSRPVHLGGLSIQVSASIGVTFYPQAKAADADMLLRQADQAMYQAKLAGKNQYCFFSDEPGD